MIRIGPFCCLPGMLAIEPSSLDAWEQPAAELFEMQRFVQWWIGDMMRYGETRFGELFYQSLPTQISEELVKRSVWLAQQFPPDARNLSLSWTHHKHIARLPPAMHRVFLDMAERECWDSQTTARRVAEFMAC